MSQQVQRYKRKSKSFSGRVRNDSGPSAAEGFGVLLKDAFFD